MADDANTGSDAGAGDNPAAERAGIYAKPDEAELKEIEAERERRLNADNRPDMAEVDNSGATLPTVEAWAKEHANDGTAGTSDPSEAFRNNPPSDEEASKIAEERERRLHPDNRPEGAEVDNTHRAFKDGRFVD